MTDAQWAVIEPLLPRTPAVLGGRPYVHSRRLI
jgi:transposase